MHQFYTTGIAEGKRRDSPILRPLYKFRSRRTHNVSEEGRARIAEAQRKRWAAAKRAK
jgi:hypothetical protein